MKQIMSLKYRTILILFFLLSVLIAFLAGLYSYLSAQILLKDSAQLFNKNTELAAVYKEIGEIQEDIALYLSTASTDSLLAFYDHTTVINQSVDRMLTTADYTERGVKIKNVGGMVKYYLVMGEDTVTARRGRNIDVYTEGYTQTVKVNSYIMRYIEEIMSGDLIDSADKYEVINSRTQNATLFNNLLIALVVAFVSFAIVLFSIRITRPIGRLADYARQIANGDYDVHIEPLNTSGEITVLFNVFSLMASSIRQHVSELHEKQQLEMMVNEQRMNNLKIKNALRESELLALQSQVNPHFIFNTINIGAKIAMMQGDDMTCNYLENAADIFRYNLKGLDCNATLREEIDNVISYMNLLTTRFGDAVHFRLDCPDDTEILSTVLPRMTLQPIVENAYIHGIGPREEGGMIRLIVSRDEEYVYVTVSDNGVGMTQETITRLLREDKEDSVPMRRAQKGHTTGIGVDNVLKRLRLFFGHTDVMCIECGGGETRVIFTLPIAQQEDTNEPV